MRHKAVGPLAGRAAIATYRTLFALLTLVAVTVQAWSLAGHGIFDPGNFFSFFTIQSNLIATALFLVGAARWRARRSASLDSVRGGAVVYMTVTGVVYFLLLRNVEVDTAIPWVNAVVHEVMPIAVVADWLIDPPSTRFAPRDALLWLAYPLAWIIYTLLRGQVVRWYPYPFLDPANGGWDGVAVYSLAILLFMLAVSAAALASANARAHVEGET